MINTHQYVEQVIERVKEEMLMVGHVGQVFFIEMERDIITLSSINWKDTQSIEEQSIIAEAMGQNTAKMFPDQQARSVIFYAEAWKSKVNTTMPVEDKRRQEIIAVSVWSAEQLPEWLCYCLPVIRDHKDRIITIEDAKPIAFKSYQLEAFVRGLQG